MTCEVVIMNQSALVFAADSATTVSYYVDGKRATRYFKGANKLFQLSVAQPVGLMIYGSGSLHDVPWEGVVREFRHKLGRDSFDKLATYSERFFETVRMHAGLFPDDLRRSVLLDAAFRAALMAWHDVSRRAAESAEPDRAAARQARVAELLNEFRGKQVAEPITEKDVAAALAAHAESVVAKLRELTGNAAIPDETLLPSLAEIAIHAVLKEYDSFLDATGVVIGGYGESEYFPSFEHYECFGFLDTHFLTRRKNQKSVSRSQPAFMDSFAIGSMIDTFRMGIGPETFESVTKATHKLLRDFAGKVRDVVAPGHDIPDLDKLISEAESSHREDWFGSSARTHYWPLARVIGALPVAEMATLAKTLVELESLKERVTQESESVAGPIDVAAISKHDGFIWIDRKHYFRPELNPRFFDRLRQDRS